MTEILTESFCERCGTRYTFESARPRTKLKGVKVLSRGLKNFVMSDETSMDEAMAAARSETDRELTTNQLDAFHKTFNFCMSCRQYTCPNCWNEAEARCLTCAPHLGQEIMPAPFPDMPAASVTPATSVTPAFLRAATTSNGSNGSNGAAHPTELIGASELIGAAETEAGIGDDEFDAAARLATLTGPAVEPSVVDSDIPYLTAALVAPASPPEAVTAPELIGEAEAVAAEPEAVAEPEAPAEPVAVAAPELVAEPEVVVAAPEAVVEPEAVAAEPEALVAPEVVALEPEVVAEPEAVPQPEPVAASEAVAAEAVAAAAPEPDLAAAAMTQQADEPDAIAADDPASTEHAAGAALAPLAAAAVIESIVADEPASTVAPEAKAAAQTSGLLRRFRPGQSLDAELDAYERDHATEPVAAAGAPPAEARPGRPDTIVPEVAAAAALAEPAPAPEPELPAPAPVVDDVVPQPVWQMVAPDPSADASVTPSLDAPAVPAAPSAAAPDAAPQWPTTAASANGLPFLGRPAAPQGGLEALWAQSSREVAATPAVAGRVNGVVQPCVSCGLSLSANARFCRRCGTPQTG
jgi:hypothetical protein